MSTNMVGVLVRRFYEEYNRGKAAAMAAMDERYATDIVVHSSTGEDMRGLKDIKQSESEVFDAFPDNKVTIDDIIVEGDKVAVRYTFTCTHKGEFHSILPTNKKIKVWAIAIIRIAGGKFVEAWERMDTLGMMQQLGVLPTPGS